MLSAVNVAVWIHFKELSFITIQVSAIFICINSTITKFITTYVLKLHTRLFVTNALQPPHYLTKVYV
jgi:hypothetical protein